MGFIGKLFAIIMFPLSILIALEELNIYSLQLPINKVYLGAALMIALQLITLVMLRFRNGKLSFMNVVTALIFIVAALAASAFVLYGYLIKETVIILAIMMFIEALYALH